MCVSCVALSRLGLGRARLERCFSAVRTPRASRRGPERLFCVGQIPAQVPLWAALALKAKAKANIVAPPWMEVEALEETLASERSSEAEFQPLPFHYLELSTALFKHAPDAFGESMARVMDLIENIRRRVHHPNLVEMTFSLLRRAPRSVRFNKIERGLRRLDGANAIFIRLNNVAAMEVRASLWVITSCALLLTVRTPVERHPPVPGHGAQPIRASCEY